MTEGFNPCFNGFTTLTDEFKYHFVENPDGFNPCFNGFTTLTMYRT